jgi:hypothetical protein
MWPVVIGQHVVGPTNNNYYKGLAAAAGNIISGGVAKVGDKYYIYHNDEWHRSGIHRWRADNLDSVDTSSVRANWNADNTSRRALTGTICWLGYHCAVPRRYGEMVI